MENSRIYPSIGQGIVKYLHSHYIQLPRKGSKFGGVKGAFLTKFHAKGVKCKQNLLPLFQKSEIVFIIGEGIHLPTRDVHRG